MVMWVAAERIPAAEHSGGVRTAALMNGAAVDTLTQSSGAVCTPLQGARAGHAVSPDCMSAQTQQVTPGVQALIYPSAHDSYFTRVCGAQRSSKGARRQSWDVSGKGLG